MSYLQYLQAQAENKEKHLAFLHSGEGQAHSQAQTICDLFEKWQKHNENCEYFDCDLVEEEAHEEVMEVLVKFDWHEPGKEKEATKLYALVTTAGGPGVRISGKLDRHGVPETQRLEYTSDEGWTEKGTAIDWRNHAALEWFSRLFYFGEDK